MNVIDTLIASIVIIIFNFRALHAEVAKLPVIKSYSNKIINASVGDKLILNIESESEDVKYTWQLNGKKLCDQATCEILTDNWGPGEYEVDVFVTNAFGEAMINYKINMIPQLQSMNYQELKPSVISSNEEILNFSFDQDYISLLKEEAYIIHKKKLERISFRKQPLIWNAKLSTTFDGVVEFALKDKYKFHLLERGEITLHEQNDQKFIFFTKGILRGSIKNIDDKSIMINVQKDIQININKECDFYLQFKKISNKKNLYITVLRGRVELITRYREAEKDAIQYQRIYIPNRAQLKLDLSRNASSKFTAIMGVPDHEEVQRLFESTSEEYMLLPVPIREEDDENENKIETIKKEINSRLKEVRELEKDENYFSILDRLKSYSSYAEDHLDLAYYLGLASKELFLFQQAEYFLNQANDLDVGKYRPLELLAHINLMKKEWSQVKDLLDDETIGKTRDPKVNFYYLGVAEYKLSNLRYSRKEFFKSLDHEKSNQVTDESSRNYIKKIEKSLPENYELSIRLLRDSNPLQISTEVKRDQDLYWKYGIDVQFLITKKLYDQDWGFANISSLTKTIGYHDDDLYFSLSQRFSVPIFFKYNKKINVHSLELIYGVEPQIGFDFLNSLRAYDVIGTRWKIKTKLNEYTFDLNFDNKMFLDPDPEHIKTFDPMTLENNSKHDLGMRLKRYELNFPFEIYPEHLMTMKFSTATYARRYINAFDRSHKKNIIEFDYEYKFFKKWYHKTAVSYLQKEYFKHDLNRNDKIQNISSTIVMQFVPMNYVECSFDFENSNSNLSDYSYKRWVFFTGLKFIH